MEPASSTPPPRGLAWPLANDRTRDAADFVRALLLPPEICCDGSAGRAVCIEITCKQLQAAVASTRSAAASTAASVQGRESGENHRLLVWEFSD